ncbi:YodC family protein [Acinetobacter calcoaceticus]|uniref:YodC family protein n=1 Tax=Acinetobacter calcoaceticus TaxID=471 RepID=UPI003A86F4AA
MSEERTPKYNIGDKVKLTVGGPNMAVAEIIYAGFGSGKFFDGNYRCQWFAGKKLDKGVFPEENLELITDTVETPSKK